jgi:hypothetical protein
MSNIFLRVFGGMVPRRDDQYLEPHSATDAQNALLYSGELRPLKEPSLAHVFPGPTDPEWKEDIPNNEIQEPPPPEEVCEVPVITGQPADGGGEIGEISNFSVVAEGTIPLLYQWYVDGEALPGEILPSLALFITAENRYSTVTVSVTNPCGVALSHGVQAGGGDPECVSWILGTGEATITNIWTNLGNYPLFVESSISMDGLLVVDGDTIWQNSGLSNNWGGKSDLKYSTDFGQTWQTAVRPLDELYDQYSDYTTIRNNAIYRSMRMIGGRLYARFMYDAARLGSIFSTTNGVDWRLEHSDLKIDTNAGDSLGYGRNPHNYHYHINENPSGELMFGGRGIGTLGTLYCWTEGQGNIADGQGNDENPNSHWFYQDEGGPGGVSKGGNGYFIARITNELGDYVFMTSPNGGDMWVADMDGHYAGNPRRVNNVYWSGGFSRWYVAAKGSWRTTESDEQKFNAYWSNRENRNYGMDNDFDKVITYRTDTENSLDADYGRFDVYRDENPYILDLSSLMPANNAPDEGESRHVGIHYNRNFKAWVLVYSFTDPVTTFPQHFYMRIATNPLDVGSWSDPVKINFQDDAGIRMELYSWGGLALDYSTTQNKWVFSSYVEDQIGNGEYAMTGWIDNPFVCELWQ